LVVPHALGRSVRFEAWEGPRLDPIERADQIDAFPCEADPNAFGPIYETRRNVKAELKPEVTLLGFCGAPWTVATYMIAGHGTADQAPARLFAYRARESFQDLIDTLITASIDYLVGQFEAGVDAVQLFDTWAGVL